MLIYMIPICFGSMWWYLSLYGVIVNLDNKSLVRNKLIQMCIATICIIISFALLIAVLISWQN